MYLGIDVGSVSTNLVVADQHGEVIKAIYTKTDARPVEVVNKGLAEIRDELGDRIRVVGAGTTGSGRELIGELCGADLITDEITAHKTGANHVAAQIGRQVDTIFEIGGQDSKFISLQDGIVVDFAMNEACAAGTGSFLEEQAEKLDINIIGEFAELALASTSPIRLGERCTVFMERDVMSYKMRGARQGGPRRRPRLLDRLQLPEPPRARAQDRRLHLLPGRHRLQRLGRRGLLDDPRQGDHRAAPQRGDRRDRDGPAGPRAHAAHARA